MIYILALILFLSGILFGWRSKKNLISLIKVTPFFLPLYVLRFSVGPLPTTLLEVFLLSIFIASLRFLDLEKLRATLLKKDVLVISVFVLLGLLQSFVAPDVISGLGIWRAFFLQPAILYILIKTLFEDKDFKSIKINLYITGILLSVIGIIQFLTGLGIPVPWDAERRITSIFPYPNALGLFLSPLAGLVLFDRDLSKPEKAVLFVVFSLAIVLAKTEAGLVSIVAGTLIVSFLKYHKKRMPIAILGLVAVILSTAIVPVREKLFLQDYSGGVRLSQWSETADMLKDNWIFGAGIGGYEEVFEPYHSNKDIEIFAYPHNWVLNVWSELGLTGTILFLTIVAIFIYKLPEFIKKSPGATLAILIILIHGLVDVPFFKNDLSIMTLLIISLLQEDAN